jgi:hypothetical protein
LPHRAKAKPIEFKFQDEARIGQKGTLTRMWARKGSRPRAACDTRCEWAYVFGAVCPERKTGAAIVMPYANTEAMNLHLREISKAVAPGAHAAAPPAASAMLPGVSSVVCFRERCPKWAVPRSSTNVLPQAAFKPALLRQAMENGKGRPVRRLIRAAPGLPIWSPRVPWTRGKRSSCWP